MYKRTVENTTYQVIYKSLNNVYIYRVDALLTFLVYRCNYKECLTACQEAFSFSSYIVAVEHFRQSGWRGHVKIRCTGYSCLLRKLILLCL